MSETVTIRPVTTKAERRLFVDFAWEAYKDDPAWVPPLKDEVHGLITRGRTRGSSMPRRRSSWPMRGGQGRRAHQRAGRPAGARAYGRRARPVGHVRRARRRRRRPADRRRRGMAARAGDDAALGPFSHSIWDEPGLLIEGFDHPPMVMMGHNRPAYRALDRGRGLRQGQGSVHLRPRHRQAASRRSSTASSPRARRNPRIRIRKVDKSAVRRARRRSSSNLSTMPGRTIGASSR